MRRLVFTLAPLALVVACGPKGPTPQERYASLHRAGRNVDAVIETASSSVIAERLAGLNAEIMSARDLAKGGEEKLMVLAYSEFHAAAKDYVSVMLHETVEDQNGPMFAGRLLVHETLKPIVAKYGIPTRAEKVGQLDLQTVDRKGARDAVLAAASQKSKAAVAAFLALKD